MSQLILRYRLFAAASGVALLSALGTAQAGQGWYVAGNVGAAFVNDSSSTATDSVGNSISFDTEFDPGFVVSGAAGYGWNNLRAEGEISYRKNDVDSLTVTNVTLAGVGSFNTAASFSGGGDVSALGIMANVWYDFPTGGKLVPFVGGGIGVAEVSLNDVTGNVAGVDALLADDSDWVFAYQIGAGIGYAFNPNLTLTLDYRLFGTADPEFKDPTGVPFDGEYLSHNVHAGLRYQF